MKKRPWAYKDLPLNGNPNTLQVIVAKQEGGDVAIYGVNPGVLSPEMGERGECGTTNILGGGR